MVRPHAVRLSRPEGGLTARVNRSVFVGNMIEVELELAGGHKMVAELLPGGEEAQLAQPGADVAVTWKSNDMRIFAA
ncbi:TOBE domain protein [compost metagenome]